VSSESWSRRTTRTEGLSIDISSLSLANGQSAAPQPRAGTDDYVILSALV
jgi:hypothetical protein